MILLTRRCVLAVIWMALLCLGGCTASGTGSDSQHQAELAQWRSTRVTALKSADGWLSYTGSGRLRPGRYSVGSGAEDAIRLPIPAEAGRVGELVIDSASASFAPTSGQGRQLLLPAQAGTEVGTRLAVADGEFYLVRTGPLWGWRFRQPGAAARHPFKGFEYYPVQRNWRLQARWQPYPQSRAVTVMTSIGTTLELQMPGEAHFSIEGRPYVLRPVALPPGDDRLMFIFTDRSSGRESYGGGRYLFTAPPRNGVLELDFNRAENPPCAVSAHVVCPVAPVDSRIEVAVLAGEKTWYPR